MQNTPLAPGMDDLTAALAASFEISNDPNKTSAPHPRFSQFKSKPSNQDQNSRRTRLLEIQKKNRFDFLSHVRKLTEDDWKDAGGDDQEEEKGEDKGMEIEVKIKKPGRYYKDQLMLSEWLVEVPSDFAEEWLMVLCPFGKRNLVVTSGFSTKSYSRSGFFLNSFPSYLPGGNRRQQNERGCSILDCLYSEVNKTYYVLDMMCWNGHQIYETETEFRLYWMNEKWQERPELMEVSKFNPLKFVPLPSFPCTPESISSAVASANFEIDGLLFYHKRTHYMFGSTPLVVWLKPYMLPEILGISVPDRQLTHQPSTYTDYATHMRQVAEDKEKRQEERKQVRGQGHRGRRGRRGSQGRGQAMDAENQDDSGASGEGGSFFENSGLGGELMDADNLSRKGGGDTGNFGRGDSGQSCGFARSNGGSQRGGTGERAAEQGGAMDAESTANQIT